MNTGYREQLQRAVPDDIAEYFSDLINRITSNGESSDVKFLSYDSSEPPCPIGPGQFTKLKLTDGACNITSFNESFIKLRIKSSLNLTIDLGDNQKAIKAAMDEISVRLKYMPAFYVGFKSGLHAIDHYRFYCDKNPGYFCEQSQAVYESALTYFTKSEEELDGTVGMYATSEFIKDLRPDVPGQYITWGQFSDCIYNNKPIDLDFEVVIKYDDFAPLQYFDLYPNSIVGNMQLEFKINNIKNMVITHIPLNYGYQHFRQNNWNRITGYNQNNSDVNSDLFYFYSQSAHYDHVCFNNIGVRTYVALPAYGKATINTAEDTHVEKPYFFTAGAHITATVGALNLISAKSYINGYNISQQNQEKIRSLLSTNKLHIPAQRIDQYSFSQTPTNTSISCNTTQTLINCSSMIFIFPRNQYELTCSFNPCCNSIQLMIDNKTLPDKPFTTYDLQYKNYTLSGLMFNDFFSPNMALRKSLGIPPLAGSGESTFTTDCSNYLMNFPLERLDSSPYVFDGITKDNCFITLNGTYTRPNFMKDDFVTYDEACKEMLYFETNTKQPPIMLLCQDTIWELSTDGIKYYYNDRNIIPALTN